MAIELTTLDGTAISAFCFGAMQFGIGADRAASEEMYAACRGAGINFFDTAHGYSDGLSETWLGDMVRSERDAVFFASKVAVSGGSGRKNILAQFDESCRRHKLECVDGLYLHRWDAQTPLEETFETLAGLKEEGKVRYIGVSNFAAWQVMKSVAVAERFDLKISLLQPMYNLVKRQAEMELLPMAADQEIAVAPYSPLGGGLLTGKYRGGATGRLDTDPSYKIRYGEQWMRDVAVALTDLAEEMGQSPATLAVAWVASHPAVTAPIISARSLDQLKPSLAAVGFEMDAALRARMTALTPTLEPATGRLEEAAKT
ncbi:aldo/keto reductase [Aliiruegeria lutimaris]|uniref:Predicted oxidoreductase n=1 Tax=Aliiruegeria lutimaris TaxID=571298 RepID=A0A1G8IVB1_9RHOB|nr:aldo/keto reductase [Aliiruegeria lutimaris]SDI22637.1 Predicted oxidoreductase [Aliiruegeria lutimaris]